MSSFKFEGMSILRVVAHTIIPRNGKEYVSPLTSNHLVPLDGESKDLMQQRMTAALGSSSHGIEVQVRKDDKNSFFQLASAAIHSADDAFIETSQILATNLAEAQTNPRWPGGILMIISGRVGENQNRFVAALKAETDKGFNADDSDGDMRLKLVKKLLLSQTQKLYKIGLLIEINAQPVEADGLRKVDNYKAFLFDHLLTATETKPAAAYFYDAFLGMSITGSSKFQTRVFYDSTKNFINSLPIDDEEKYSLGEALRSELRSQKAVINLREFSKEHLPAEHQKDYIQTLQDDGFPAHAVIKDTDYIKSKLRRPRKVVFNSGVKIQVPSDKDFQEHVEVFDQVDGFTQVRIKGVVQERE
jgi:hypothetical protein